jgi:hypothetical protein
MRLFALTEQDTTKGYMGATYKTGKDVVKTPQKRYGVKLLKINHMNIEQKIEEFKEKVKELKNAEIVTTESRVCEFGYRATAVDYDGVMAYTITDWGNIEKWVESSLKDTWNEALESVEKEMKPELVNTREESDGDWFYGKGNNDYRSETLEIIKKLRI